MSRTSNLLRAGPAAVVALLLGAAVASEPPARVVSPGATEPQAKAAPAPEVPRATSVASTLFPIAPSDDPGPPITEADLAPAFAEESVGRAAKGRFDAGRFLEAVVLLDKEKGAAPAVRFLRALALWRARRFAEAGVEFVALAPAYPQLADRCNYLGGLAFEAAGDLPRAAGAFRALGESAASYLDARRALARVLARQGDLAGAQAILAPMAARRAPVSGWDLGGDALFDLARLQESRGTGKLAAASYLEVWAQHANSARAPLALERAQALGRQPTVEQRIQRGEQLMEAHHSARAVEILQPILEAPPKGLAPGALCRARFAFGKAQRKMHQHARAVAALQVVVDLCPKDDLWARALYVAGTSATVVNPELALSLYRRLAEEKPDHPFADDALFFQAELLERAGRARPARIALARVARLYPDGDYRAEALFRIFWIERAEGRLERGLKVLARLERGEAKRRDPASLERALYWRARTLAELHRSDAALEQYEVLTRTFPAGFYALLARSRIGELAPARLTALAAEVQGGLPEAPDELRQSAGALGHSPRLGAALELLRLGLPELAQEELLAVDRAALREEATPNGLRLLVRLLARTGDARLAHAVARTELRGDLGSAIRLETLPIWKVAFPLAFREPIARRSQEAGIDPDLLQALIREESALDPKVHSWAGAVGLCQLMPFTAREVAGWLKLPGVSLDALHEPDTNIRLGATYLARLIKQFRKNLVLSLAAYNAGGGAVNLWLRQTPARDLDEFIEQIPIAETRNYVKKVLRSYAAYQFLYGHGERVTNLGAHLLASK
jgi:soluble lytic murein transglycosylase